MLRPPLVFPFSRVLIVKKDCVERQSRLCEFELRSVRCVYVPMIKEYSRKAGLSERLLRRRLEAQGWEVWRGGILHELRKFDVFPNVRRRYALLFKLLGKHKHGMLELLQYWCHVHHGMPDFLCFRNGEFLFVECKLQYECVSKRQKKCIERLQQIGFVVEVHRLVDERTKTRDALVDSAGNKQVREVQEVLRRRFRAQENPLEIKNKQNISFI